MNYPVWQLEWAGGGLIIAVVAVVHLYIAQFAVGGGLFLVLTEKLALKRADPAMQAYLRRHARFFMLLTMVVGAVTGVGIWFTVSLLAPGATSILIHNFVFAWAAEWVCFLVEVAAIFIYYYSFDRMQPSTHMAVGWIYFAAAWLSLLLINAIVAFMLTPGKWLEGGGFWEGFFNPSMLPSTLFRTALSISLAGIYGLLTAVLEKNRSIRQELVRYTAAWMLAPVVFLAAASLWYLQSIPESTVLLKRWPEVISAGRWFVYCTTATVMGALLLLANLPRTIQTATVALVLVVGLVWTGAFEWMREAARRPYLIRGLMYSNGLTGPQVELAAAEGFANTARWFGPPGLPAAGQRMFRFQCSACHSIGGPMNDIRPLTSGFTLPGLEAHLRGQGRVNRYMPPVAGTKAEKQALARFIAEKINGLLTTTAPLQNPPISTTGIQPALFDPASAQYVLLAWVDSDFCGSLADRRFRSLGRSATKIRAQLILRGETPEIVTGKVNLVCRIKGRKALFMGFDKEQMAFVTELPNLVPYDSGKQPQFPVAVNILALDKSSGREMATVTLAAGPPARLGCRQCHGADGGKDNPRAAGNHILKVHDRMNHTDLTKQAATGTPVNCIDCHGAKNAVKPAMELSAAVHGLHANYLTGQGAAACTACHLPGRTRGLHMEYLEMDCTNCHGQIEEHALGLLRQQQEANRPGPDRLMKHLVAAGTESKSRKAWRQMPDCLNCHREFQQPDTDQHSAGGWSENFGQRSDDAGILCAGCHGAAHRLYPARGQDASLVTFQYQGNPYPVGSNSKCDVCHTVAMEEEIHHPNMLTMFRNTVQTDPEKTP